MHKLLYGAVGGLVLLAVLIGSGGTNVAEAFCNPNGANNGVVREGGRSTVVGSSLRQVQGTFKAQNIYAPLGQTSSIDTHMIGWPTGAFASIGIKNIPIGDNGYSIPHTYMIWRTGSGVWGDYTHLAVGHNTYWHLRAEFETFTNRVFFYINGEMVHNLTLSTGTPTQAATRVVTSTDAAQAYGHEQNFSVTSAQYRANSTWYSQNGAGSNAYQSIPWLWNYWSGSSFYPDDTRCFN